VSYPYSAAVEASLDKVSELDLDPTAAVYDRLFAAHPELKPHFWRDDTGAIRGEMLSRVFEAILDFIGERKYAGHMIGTELITHEGYDVPREAFATFFGIVGDSVAELLGPEWTPAMSEGWAAMLADIDRYVQLTPRSNAA